MNTRERLGLMIAVVVAVQMTVTGAGKADETPNGLKASYEKLRAFAMETMVGKKYPELKTASGRTYVDAVVVAASGRTVEICYSDGGKEHTAELDVANGPSEWSVLVPPAELRARTSAGASGKPSQPGEDVAEAIVVIEGDAGAGTGFLVEDEGKLYLYTAAHVLSGNKTLKVKLRTGRQLKKFGRFEASGGADLVRIELLEDFDKPLKLADKSGQSSQDMTVFAAGNSGGGGTVGFLEGKIQGVGAESIEIDAGVIQGNSGGPILDGITHEVLGVVTHLVAARKDQWAKETRFSEIRRFGCRVDRAWDWDERPIGVFLEEGQQLKELTDLNELMVLALQPSQWDNPGLREYENHAVVREIRSLQKWIDSKRGSATGVSESDRSRKVAAFFSGLRASSRRQMRDFDPERFVWFHREMAEQVILLREEIDKTCDDAIDDYR